MNRSDDPRRNESWLINETAAVMHGLVDTITDAPPLRQPEQSPARVHEPRRWVRWAAPLAAAAAVVAVAGSLVIIKGTPNYGAAHPTASTSATPEPATGPDGVPRYYAARTMNNGIVVGDSVTGKTLATFALPANTDTGNLTAAADDRTFVDPSATSPLGGDAAQTLKWYEVQLAPGTAHPARLTLLPIKSQPLETSQLTYLTDALSSDGTELAVADTTAAGGLAVQVFSVSTGQLQHEWTTNDPSLSIPKGSSQGLTEKPSLTWIDGDRKLAVVTQSWAPASTSKHPFLGFGFTNVVRELNVAGPASGDLLADGTVAWSVPTWEYPSTVLQACTGGILNGPDLIGADGTTLGCMALTGPGNGQASLGAGRNLGFLTYPLATGATVAGQARIDYRVTPTKESILGNWAALWISPDGDALIATWNISQPVPGKTSTTLPPATGKESQHSTTYIGVVSHGKFTPLRFPSGFDRETQFRSITF